MTNFPSMPNPQQPQPAAYPGAGFQAPQQGGAYGGYGQPATGYGAGPYGAPGQASPYPGVAQPGGFGVPGAPGYQAPSTPAKSFVVILIASSLNLAINPSTSSAAGFGVGMLVATLVGIALSVWSLVSLILIAARKSMYATDSTGRALA